MSLEEALAANTLALEANTAAHTKLAEVAMAAQGGKAADKPAADKAPTAAEKAAATKKANAAKKAAAAKKAETPEVAGAVDEAAIRAVARDYLSGDDEAERDAKKANVSAAFKHLGAKKLTDLADDEDRAKLAAYIAYWKAGHETIDFEDIDALVAEAGEGAGTDDDDMLG